MTLRKSYEIQLKVISVKSVDYINRLTNIELLSCYQIALKNNNCTPFTGDEFHKELNKLNKDNYEKR